MMGQMKVVEVVVLSKDVTVRIVNVNVDVDVWIVGVLVVVMITEVVVGGGMFGCGSVPSA